MKDLNSPEEIVEVSVGRVRNERTLWVNVDGICVLRINNIGDQVTVTIDYK